MLSLALTLTAAIPALALAAYLLWDGAREAQRQQLTELGARADFSIRATEAYLEQHRRGVELLAQIMGGQGEHHRDVEALQRELTFFSETYSGFSTMLIARANGEIAATAADARMGVDDATIEALRGQSVADRAYFQVPMATGRSHISDVFMGRGYREAPLIAISHPIVMDGQRIGVAEGSLNLSHLAEFGDELLPAPEWSLLLLDGAGNLAYTSRERHRLATVAPWPGRVAEAADTASSSQPFEFEEADGTRWVGAARRLSNGWRLYVSAPQRAWTEVLPALGVSLALLAVILVLTALTARVVGRRLTDPVARLVEFVRTYDPDHPRQVLPAASNAWVPQEMVELQQVFKDREIWLSDTLQELRTAHDQERRLREKLEAEVASRQQQIESQTAEIRRQSEQLRETAHQAEAASRAKSQFLSNMSHEIRTPLTAVIGFVQRALGKNGLEPELSDELTVALREARHLEGLINDILDLSRIEEGQIEVRSTPVALPSLISDILAVEGPNAAGKKLSLRLEPYFPLPAALETDAVRLRQILTNLIGNAIKFTESGEVIVALRWRAEERLIDFVVRDTGIGISPEQQDRLFQRFSQADPSITRRFGGSGLGLAISRHLAKLMGGDIRLESRAGAGACFTLTLPAPGTECEALWTQESGENAVSRDNDVALPRALRGHVLVAEDNATLQQLIRSQLADLGLSSDIVGDGVEAIAAAARENYDLVLMDMHMPRMDGLTATREILARDPMLPIIALTADVMRNHVAEQLAAGCRDTISKPIHPSHMVRVLSQYLPAAQASLAGSTTAGLVESLRSDFVANLAAEYARPLDVAWETGDIERALGIVHQLHGLAGNLGFDALSRSAGAAELLLRRNADAADQDAAVAEVLGDMSAILGVTPSADPA